ncbi:MAG: hypothetical protein IJI57_10900 [Flexilinea sp.]|nr:hypothetical protein [Flexilinea sp.]
METILDRKKIEPVAILSHIRKNHAMEHATIHLLTKAIPGASFAGYSFIKGYWILGKAELQDVQKAAELALARMKNGEQKLAVHPGCGTNIAVTGLCTASAAMLTTLGQSKDDSKLERFSAFTSAGIIGALLSRPLGPWTQKNITTDANVSDLNIVSISCSSVRGTPAFFVQTTIGKE